MADRVPDGAETVEDLVHHGVKGMRWGVIRAKAARGSKVVRGTLQSAGSSVKKGALAANNARISYKLKKQDNKRSKGGRLSYKKLTDAELNSRINRLEREQRYRELKADRHLVRGRQVTRQILEQSLTKAGTYAATKAMKNAFDTGWSDSKKMGAERMFDRAAKAATKAAEAVQTAAAEANKTAAATPTPVKKPSKPAGPALSKAKAPKQLEKAKSYKQTKPSMKPKRRPRNPGSPL